MDEAAMFSAIKALNTATNAAEIKAALAALAALAKATKSPAIKRRCTDEARRIRDRAQVSLIMLRAELRRRGLPVEGEEGSERALR